MILAGYNPLDYFVDEIFLKNMFKLNKSKSGYINVHGVYKEYLKENGDHTDPIIFQGQVIEGLNNPDFTYSIVKNS